MKKKYKKAIIRQLQTICFILIKIENESLKKQLVEISLKLIKSLNYNEKN
jgi:hypothetical protein